MQSARFLNVDIDLTSRSGFEALLAYFASSIIVLRADDGVLSFELGAPPKSTRDAAVKLSKLLKGMPGAAKRDWDRCASREFNVGVEANTIAADLELPDETLQLLIGMGLSVRVTIYPSARA